MYLHLHVHAFNVKKHGAKKKQMKILKQVDILTVKDDAKLDIQ